MRSTQIKKNFCGSSLWTCVHHMVILKNQKKITDLSEPNGTAHGDFCAETNLLS